MKRKRMDRDGGGFQRFPDCQMRVDTQEFHGLLSMILTCSGAIP